MNTDSRGFVYQPSALEEAYGIYLLQTVFQINVDGGKFCNNARISGREAVPFLSKSGVDRQILRNVWAVADPQTVGSLISPQQFYTLLRLTALAQVGILGQALQMNAFVSPVEVLQQSLYQTCQQQLPLALFEGISIPNQEYLFQMNSKSSLQMQHQQPPGQIMSDPFGSLSSHTSSASWGSGFGVSLSAQQPSSIQQQQQQTPNSHACMHLTLGSASSFDVGSPAAAPPPTTAAAATSVPAQAPLSVPAPLQLSSIEDAFGGLVEVDDAPLPSLEQYTAASTAKTTITTKITKTEEPEHDDDDDDFGDFAGLSAEPAHAAQASTAVADPTATVGSAATTGTQLSLLSDVFGDMSQQQQQQPPIPASQQSLVDPTSTVGSVTTTVTQGSLLEDVFGASGGEFQQQQQQQQQQQTPFSVAQTQPAAQLVSEDENGEDDDDDDFGDFTGTTKTSAATTDDSPQPVGDSGPSGWDALDAIAAVQDAPLPALSSFGEPTTTEQEQQELTSNNALLRVENVEQDEDETDFGDFEGTMVEEGTSTPVAQSTDDGFAGSFANPPMSSSDIQEDTTFKATESASQEFGLFGEAAHAPSTESASNGFAGSGESSSMANVQVKNDVIPEVAKCAPGDFGLFGEASAASTTNATAVSVSQQELQSSDSQGPTLSGWDALDALGGIQDAPLKSLETLGSNDEPMEKVTSDAAGNRLQTSSGDQLDGQKNTHQVDMFGSSTDQVTNGITRAISGDSDFGDFQNETNGSNKDTVFRPNNDSGDAAAQSSNPADTSNVTNISRRQTAERIDSAYYSAQSSMSEEFDDALQVQPDQSSGDQQMPREDVEASGLEAKKNPTSTHSFFGFPSSSPEAESSDDPFSAFDSLATTQPTIQPLSSFGQENAEKAETIEKTLDQNLDERAAPSAPDALGSESAGHSTNFAPSSSGDDLEGFSGFEDGAALSHNDAAPHKEGDEALSGFAVQCAPESGDLHGTSNVTTEPQAPKDDSFDDFGAFASAPDKRPTPVITDHLEMSSGAKAVDTESFDGFGNFSGPHHTASAVHDAGDDSFGDFGHFSTAGGQVVSSALQGNTSEEGVGASVVQITQQPQSGSQQQMQEVDLFASSGLEPRSQDESPEDESFGDFGDFNAAQDQIEEGTPKEGDALASSNVAANAQTSPEESFGDFGDFNAATQVQAPDAQKEEDLFATSTVEAKTQPRRHQDESFGDFGDFSAAKNETTEMPASIGSSIDAKQDDNAANFGDFASFDESKPPPSAPFEPDPETKNLVALRDFICSSSIQLPEGIRRQGGDCGGHVNFRDVFDANIGMEVPVSDERKKRIQRSIQIMTVLSTSQTKLASTYWGQTFKISHDELSLACNLMEEVAEMAKEERDLVRKKLETYFYGIGEFVRVCRSIAATIGDLLMLDPSALLTVDTLNSSWCSLVLIEDCLAVEKLWKKFRNLAKTVGITQGQESEYRLESLTEIRAQAAQGSDRPVCCFTLQPLFPEPTLPTKTPLKWNDRPFMACAANFLANRIVSYATSTSFSEQDAK